MDCRRRWCYYELEEERLREYGHCVVVVVPWSKLHSTILSDKKDEDQKMLPEDCYEKCIILYYDDDQYYDDDFERQQAILQITKRLPAG